MNVLWALSLTVNSLAVGGCIVSNDWSVLSIFNLIFIPLSAYMIARNSK